MTKTTPTLKSLIAKKKYYYVNSDITVENFPVPEKFETENWKIIKMEKSFSSEEALARIKSEGCRPANIYELAAFTAANPEQFPKGVWTGMIAFGTIFTDSDGYHRVPRVSARGGGDFGFRLGFFEGGWGSDYCLLCFCDPSLATSTLSTDQSSDSLTLPKELIINNVKYTRND